MPVSLRHFRSRGLDRLLEYTDLVSAGVMGLRAAVGKFDPERGTPLASFAYPFVTGAIRDELEKAALIRLPREVASLAAKIIRAKDELSVKLGEKPTEEEIAVHLGISPERVSQLLQTLSQVGKPLHSRPRSAQTTEAGGGGQPRFDANTADAWDIRGQSHNYRADADGAGFGAGDDEAISAEEVVETDKTNARLYDALYQLTKQEREVVFRYFDLVQNPDVPIPNTHGGESLTNIARTMGISKQRASALQRRALAKLRRSLKGVRESGNLGSLDV